MAAAVQITRDLWMLKMGMVNAYLLASQDGLVLIDAGWPGKADVIFNAMHSCGQDPKNIRHLVLTHGHIDHAGSAADVLARTGARSYAHAADLDLMQTGHALHPGTTVIPGLIPKLIDLLFIQPGGKTYKPFSVHQTLEDGARLPMAPDVEVIHSPGHCAGHLVLLLRQEGLLVAGDICSNVIGLDYSIVNEDHALARHSILRVSDYPFERAVFGHGKPLNQRANRLLAERFSGSK